MTEVSLTIETDDLKGGRGDVDPGTGGARVNGSIHCSTNSWNIKKRKCRTRLIWDACFLTSSRSLRKLLNVGTNSILVISLPRTNASSWIEKANVLLTFHYKTKIKSIKMFCHRFLQYNFLSINWWFTSNIMAAILIDRNIFFFYPRNFICFHAKKLISIVLTSNMATVTQGCGGNMAVWLECWTCNPQALSSKPALASSWRFSQYSWIHFLGHNF